MKIIKSILKSWLFLLIFFVILFVAFLVRIKNLTILPVFVDEAIYVRWAQVMRAEATLRFLPLSDGKPPLFMWTIIPFFKIFSNPLFAGRMVSVFSGIGSLLGIFFLSNLLFKSKKVSLFAVTLCAISPFAVFFDRLALVDSMLSMFGIWTLVFAIKTAKDLRLDYAIITGFLLGGAMLTKSPALFFEILIPSVFIFIFTGKKALENIKNILKLVGLFGVTYFISQIMYNILRLGPNFQLLTSRNYDYVYPVRHLLENPLDPFVPHLKDIFAWFVHLGPWPLLILFVAGLFYGIIKKSKEVLLLSLWIFIPLFAQAMYAKVFTARYILFILPYLFIISSLFLLINFKRLVAVNFLIVILFFILSLKQDFLLLSNPQKADIPGGERSGYMEDWTSGYGITEVADYLKKEHLGKPDKTIVVGTDGYFGTLPDGLQIYLNNYPKIVITGVEVRFFKVPNPLIESANSGNDTYLLVNSSRFFIDNPLNEGLSLIAQYPRAIKPNGVQEKLLFFKVSPRNI